MREWREEPLYGPVLHRVPGGVIWYFALGVGLFSAFSLVLVVPLCYVQVTNMIRNTTTHERFATNLPTHVVGTSQDHPPRISQADRNSLLSDASDTNSMLLQPDDQWAFFSGTSNTKSDPRPSVPAPPPSSCCTLCPKPVLPSP